MRQLSPELIDALNNAKPHRWRIAMAGDQFKVLDPFGRELHQSPFADIAAAMNWLEHQFIIHRNY